jgi:hypothetical protein
VRAIIRKAINDSKVSTKEKSAFVDNCNIFLRDLLKESLIGTIS